jgi:molybdopterin-guanine dinucleotide biosynthesis protein A
MTQTFQDCTISGAILAGGEARRLGRVAKGSIEVAPGVSLVRRLVCELARAGIMDTIVVANDADAYAGCGCETVPDLRRGIGPLGGVEAALSHFTGRSDATLLVPCDLPLFSAGEAGALVDAFTGGTAPLVFAHTGVFFGHPLCAVIHNGLLPQIAAAIDAGERALRGVWQRVGAQAVPFGDETPFLNINTPEDLEKWRMKHSEVG